MSETTKNRTIALSAFVPEKLAGMRLDQVLAKLFQEHSRSRLQDWIKQGYVLVDQQQVNQRHKVLGGEEIKIEAEWLEQTHDESEAIPLNIIYEDDTIIIINKAAGLVTQPGAGNRTGTLLNALLHHDETLNLVPRAGIVHRLDKETTGLMVIAKTPESHTALVAAMQEREIKREYKALVKGKFTAGGTVHQPIGRDPKHRTRMAIVLTGKEAITHYRIDTKFQNYALLTCQLETGRTHQIRVHMAHIRHPIVGDPVYGGRLSLPKGCSENLANSLRKFKRQALHAFQLTLEHPSTGEEMSWQAELPEDFKQLIEILSNEELA